MNRMNRIAVKLLCAGSMFLLGFSSCIKEIDLSQPTQKPQKGDYFDFQTTLDYSVSVDLGLQNYPVLIEIYSENPFEENDGVGTPKDIEPIYRGITDASGKLTGETVLPSYIKKAYLYSPYVGVPFMETEVTTNGISFDVTNGKTETRSTRSMDYTYPADTKVLGDWDASGYPAYLQPARFAFPENELYHITKATACPSNTKLEEYHPEYFGPAVETGVPIVKKTKVNLIMIGKYAPSVNNTILYYTYPTGQKPTSTDEIQKIIAYPVSAGISCGSNVQLRYWNKDTDQFEDEFPAGVTIGWGISSSAFRNGNIGNSAGNHNYYSVQALNNRSGDEGNPHSIALFDKENNAVVVGIEDRPLNSQKANFTDVIVYCHADVEGAIDESNLPALQKSENPGPAETDNYTTYFGILAFEDLWPGQGDYDLNDVVIRYESKVYKNAKNQITSTIDRITPYWDGSGYNKYNAFGYQLSVAPNKIASVNIEYDNYTFAASPLFQFSSNGLEERVGNDNAIVIVADNMKLAVKQKSRFTVTTTFSSPQKESAGMLPPYNPFIVIDAQTERGKEVHLPNYTPTLRADASYFGTQNDISDETQQMYYIAKENMPYAIHIPNIKEFECSDEGVRIDENYPDFKNWVTSQGTDHTDWYLHKQK